MNELRFALQGAINSRMASLRNGRCLRNDHDSIRVSIARAQAFLSNYPVANDERVQKWCREHIADVTRIVPGNQPRVLARLIMEELKPKTKAVA